MLCKLCKQEEAIKNSHVIPRFVSEWLKATSRLGGLRNVEQPNLRRQDATKIPLLCRKCENRLSRRGENPFAQNIFYPFNNDEGIKSFAYSDWLLYFVVLMNWRVGMRLLKAIRSEDAAVGSYFEMALSDWRNFLLDNPSGTNHYAYHLFFDSIYQCQEFVGSYYDEKYALQTISYALPYGKTRSAVYIKLPGMTLFTCVNPPEFGEWDNTRISTTGIVQSTKQRVTDQFFWECMRDDASNATHKMEAMSDKQKRELADKIKTTPPIWKIRQARSKKKKRP